MNLCIDIGNTRIKMAIFNGNELIDFYVLEPIKLSENNFLPSIIAQYTIKNAVLSAVADPNYTHLLLEQITPILAYCTELTATSKVPIINNYATPKTLGKDRLAAVVGANSLFPQTDLLVIDAGTCIKYDFIDKKGQYWGGSISPGLQMKAEALHVFTKRLPKIELPQPPNTPTPLMGFDTPTSMLSGIIWGSLSEIKGMIEQYKVVYPTLKPILTGGDATFFEEALMGQVLVQKNLVLYGLNRILQYQINGK